MAKTTRPPRSPRPRSTIRKGFDPVATTGMQFHCDGCHAYLGDIAADQVSGPIYCPKCSPANAGEDSAPKPAFSAGDLVALKSGGPPMTVMDDPFETEPGVFMVPIAWFEHHEMRERDFAAEALRPYADDIPF